jgi:hypothetical protein
MILKVIKMEKDNKKEELSQDKLETIANEILDEHIEAFKELAK